MVIMKRDLYCMVRAPYTVPHTEYTDSSRVDSFRGCAGRVLERVLVGHQIVVIKSDAGGE